MDEVKRKLWTKYKLDEKHPTEGIYLMEAAKAATGFCLAFSNQEVIYIYRREAFIYICHSS